MKIILLILAIVIVITYPIISSLHGPREPLAPTGHNDLIMVMMMAGLVFPAIAFLLTQFLRKGFKSNKDTRKKP